jgi:hypothetical protein
MSVTPSRGQWLPTVSKQDLRHSRDGGVTRSALREFYAAEMRVWCCSIGIDLKLHLQLRRCEEEGLCPWGAAQMPASHPGPCKAGSGKPANDGGGSTTFSRLGGVGFVVAQRRTLARLLDRAILLHPLHLIKP